MLKDIVEGISWWKQGVQTASDSASVTKSDEIKLVCDEAFAADDDLGLRVETYAENRTTVEKPDTDRQKEAEQLRAGLQKTASQQGPIGKVWNWGKNAAGFGAGSNMAEEEIMKFEKGEVSLEQAEDALKNYQLSQEMAVDIAADVASGIAAVGVYVAAVAAAPVTGGASIAAGVVAAGAAGAGIKAGIKAADAAMGDREYDTVGEDLATGLFGGVVAPATGGLGGVVGKTLATKVGVRAVTHAGKEVVQTSGKQTAKAILTNPTGFTYKGGTVVQRGAAYAAEFAADGAAGGAAYNAFDTAYDGGDLGDIAKAAGEGAVGGLILSPIIGGGMKSAGIAGGKISNKLKHNKFEAPPPKTESPIFKTEEGLFLQEQVASKKLSPNIMEIAEEGKLTECLSDDISLVKYAEKNNIPLMDAYIPSGEDFNIMLKNIKPGDVFEVAGKLHISPDGNVAVPLNITKQDYFDLFPPVKRFANSQGEIGDCYLVTDLTKAYGSPIGRTKLLQMFSREDNNIVLKFPNSKTSVRAKIDEIPSLTDSKYLIDGAKGFQMLEYSYGNELQYNAIRAYTKYLTDKLDKMNSGELEYNKILRELTEMVQPGFDKIPVKNHSTGEWQLRALNELDDWRAFGNAANTQRGQGHSTEGVSPILGFKANNITSTGLYDVPIDIQKITKTVSDNGFDNPNVAYSAATRPTMDGIPIKRVSEDIINNNLYKNGTVTIELPSKSIVDSHVYNVIPQPNGTFDIINPWNTAAKYNITPEELTIYFKNFYITKYN